MLENKCAFKYREFKYGEFKYRDEAAPRLYMI